MHITSTVMHKDIDFYSRAVFLLYTPNMCFHRQQNKGFEDTRKAINIQRHLSSGE